MPEARLKPDSGSVLDLAIKEMNRRNAVHAERYLPYYMSSIILHVLNLRNQKDPFYYDESGPYNFRMHHLHLTPTGGGKTYWVKNIGRARNALIRGTVGMTYKGSMTAAAFTGSVAPGANGKEPKKIQGMAEKYDKHIIMIEEFHSTLKSMSGPHGEDLENHFLTALDSGWVFRDLRNAEIAFQTHCTIQAASQFTRIKTSSGMLRRFMLTSFKPTLEDMARLKAARRARRQLVYSEEGTMKVRKQFNEMTEDLINIEDLALDFDKIDAVFDKFQIQHYDEDIYERFIIGLNLCMKRDIVDIPVITITDGMEQYIKDAIQWRHEALMGSELSLALSTIRDYCNTHGDMATSVYRLKMINFGLSFEESQMILGKLSKYRVIRTLDHKIKMI